MRTRPRWVLAVIALVAASAAADPETDRIADEALVEVRAHFARAEFADARALLIATYAKAPRPDLLFALGQVEFNLGTYAAAIDYFERFLETAPDAEQAALAQQGIGAARAQLAQPRPPPLPTPPPAPPAMRHVRQWDRLNTGLVILGGTAIGIGIGVLALGYRRGQDHTGSLTDYDRRLDRSLTLQWTGGGVALGGAVLIGTSLVRYGVRRVAVESVEIMPTVTPTAVGLVVGRAW